MKYLFAPFILLFCTLQTFGQQDYFIYLQTDNNQTFYLRSNNTVYSSTASGYLILAKLPDSAASITIGFAKAAFPEQQFSVPVNRRDAGYLLKNFGEKGWGLFNLQTMAVIMNSNAAQEKKSPEITGIRKNDAFSLLLANAVNDTAVLYVANKPVKVLPPEPAAAAEKKMEPADTVAAAPVGRDTAALVSKKPLVNGDSNLSVKTTAKPPISDSLSNAPVKPAAGKTAINNKKVLADSLALAKNAAKKAGKPVVAPLVKDTVLNSGTKPNPPATTAAINRPPVRRDTIIMISGRPAEDPKIAAERAAKQAAARKKDSLDLAKKQNGKNSTAAKKPAADSIRKDTLISKASIKNDTAALVKTETPVRVQEKQEAAVVEAPPKRTRPLLYKAADLITDTSYVAVFVDESKEKFDTIRISIPFGEAAVPEKKDAVTAKEAAPREKPVAAKKVIDSLNNASAKKADTAKETAEKEKLAVTKTPPPVVTPVQTDSSPVNQPAKDSQAVTAKKDAPATPTADSVKNAKGTALFMNSDCKETALDTDIDKLRIKMLLVASDEEKIALAKKVFRQKCFLTAQVKALSELFKTDEGKYKWFDAVYAFVADSGNFSRLSELLKDEYYLNRFKAMLRN